MKKNKKPSLKESLTLPYFINGIQATDADMSRLWVALLGDLELEVEYSGDRINLWTRKREVQA